MYFAKWLRHWDQSSCAPSTNQNGTKLISGRSKKSVTFYSSFIINVTSFAKSAFHPCRILQWMDAKFYVPFIYRDTFVYIWILKSRPLALSIYVCFFVVFEAITGFIHLQSCPSTFKMSHASSPLLHIYFILF